MNKTILSITLVGIIAVAGALALTGNGLFDPLGAKAQTTKAVEQTETNTGQPTANAEQTKTNADADPNSDTNADTSPAASSNTNPEEETSFHVDVEIKTPYYSITVPADWMGSVTIETVDNVTGKWLKLFRRDSGGFAGHLFDILLTGDEKYKMIADHELLGELQDAAGNKYHVVAVFPTDIQFSREDRENYNAMFDKADAILDGIEAADGCVYEKAARDVAR